MNNTVASLPISPYREAWAWINQHSGASSAGNLSKLLLTLANGGFSLAECFHGLDDTRLDLALRVVNHFAVYERDAELSEIERHLLREQPRLAAVTEAAHEAREVLQLRWRREDARSR